MSPEAVSIIWLPFVFLFIHFAVVIPEKIEKMRNNRFSLPFNINENSYGIIDNKRNIFKIYDFKSYELKEEIPLITIKKN